jgi:hypothetical protein
MKSTGSLPDNCSVDSQWMSAERKYSSEGGNISIESITTVKQPFISNQELKSAAFDTFRKELRRCLPEKLIIYKKKAD